MNGPWSLFERRPVMDTHPTPRPENPEAPDLLAENSAPDPTGPPIPVNTSQWSFGWVTGTALAAVTGAVIAPAFITPTCCAGATRSARIEWEQRAQLIAAAEGEA